VQNKVVHALIKLMLEYYMGALEACIWSGRDWRPKEQVIWGTRRAICGSSQPNISTASQCQWRFSVV